MTFYGKYWYWSEIRYFFTVRGINPDRLSLIEQEIYYLTWNYTVVEQITPEPFSQN